MLLRNEREREEDDTIEEDRETCVSRIIAPRAKASKYSASNFPLSKNFEDYRYSIMMPIWCRVDYYRRIDRDKDSPLSGLSLDLAATTGLREEIWNNLPTIYMVDIDDFNREDIAN